jgi:hypothetical protein
MWIRGEFERNRHLTDLVQFFFAHYVPEYLKALQALIEDKLKMGRREIRQVLPTASTTSHSHQ